MGKRTIKRSATKERFWRRAVKRREKSGLSVRAFCEQQGLTESAFYFWQRELRKRDAQNAGAGPMKAATSSRTKESLDLKRSPRPAFAAVTVAKAENADAVGAIEIVVRDTLRVRVARGFDAQTLGDVLAVLEERPC